MAKKRDLKDTVNDPMVKKNKSKNTPTTKKSIFAQKTIRNLATKHEIAKAGMFSSMGALFLTGFLRFKGARFLHPWAGGALLGFALWHHILNSQQKKAR